MLTDTNSFLSHDNAILSKSWFLTAGATDARGLMPLTMVAARAIEIATIHANAMGVGYAELAEENIGWVLARLSIEMTRYPRINETYTLTTWVEGYNRYFSDRCFEMTDADGQPLAHIRSMWVAINFDTRTMADLGVMERRAVPATSDRKCPLDKCRAPIIARDAEQITLKHTFGVCDIDFNRHVNAVRYIEAAMNLKSLDFFDSNSIKRFDVSYEHECLYNEDVRMIIGPGSGPTPGEVVEFHSETHSRRAVAMKFIYEPIAESI